jgi:hypothetical protein
VAQPVRHTSKTNTAHTPVSFIAISLGPGFPSRHFPDDFLLTAAVSSFFNATPLGNFVKPILDAPDA